MGIPDSREAVAIPFETSAAIYSKCGVSPLITQQTMYLDKTFAPGVTYYYSVTAIDQSPRHNESDFSQELKVVAKRP